MRCASHVFHRRPARRRGRRLDSERMFAYPLPMQLRLDAADRLVELVEERRGPVYVEEAARRLFALRHAPVGMARSLLEEVVGEDARLAWRGDAVGLADPPGGDLPL